MSRAGRRLLFLPLRPFLPEGYFLRRELNRINKRFGELVEKAKNEDERQDYLSEWSFEKEEIVEMLNRIDTRKTIRQAVRFGMAMSHPALIGNGDR